MKIQKPGESSIQQLEDGSTIQLEGAECSKIIFIATLTARAHKKFDRHGETVTDRPYARLSFNGIGFTCSNPEHVELFSNPLKRNSIAAVDLMVESRVDQIPKFDPEGNQIVNEDGNPITESLRVKGLRLLSVVTYDQMLEHRKAKIAIENFELKERLKIETEAESMKQALLSKIAEPVLS